MIEPNCEKSTTLNFELKISNDENYSKFNIFPILGLKIMKFLYEIPLTKRFLETPRPGPNSLN